MSAERFKQRIWPLNDSPCVFPDDVVLCEYKERPVHGKAVLSVGYWVIQSHGPGPLRLGLLHGSRESRRVLCVPAAFHVPIAGLRRSERGLVSKPSHSSKEMSRAPGLKGLSFRTSTKDTLCTRRKSIHLQSSDSFSSAADSS